MTEDDVRRIIKEEIEKFLTVEFHCAYHSGTHSQYKVELYFKEELISTDYQIIQDGN